MGREWKYAKRGVCQALLQAASAAMESEGATAQHRCMQGAGERAALSSNQASHGRGWLQGSPWQEREAPAPAHTSSSFSRMSFSVSESDTAGTAGMGKSVPLSRVSLLGGKRGRNTWLVSTALGALERPGQPAGGIQSDGTKAVEPRETRSFPSLRDRAPVGPAPEKQDWA